MIKVCWSIAAEWNGASERHWVDILYLTEEQYELFKKDLENEETSDEVLIGSPTVPNIHKNNKNLKLQVRKAFDCWNDKKYGKKQPYQKEIIVVSSYNIINAWDLQDDQSDCDRAGCEVSHSFKNEGESCEKQ